MDSRGSCDEAELRLGDLLLRGVYEPEATKGRELGRVFLTQRRNGATTFERCAAAPLRE
ncbi:MAG TPA: hypothetical protein VFS90_15760 [Pyrinomonadaceae bacterium]|nr:hypothetical protein [Pyrinomonadaceae bacterium]